MAHEGSEKRLPEGYDEGGFARRAATVAAVLAAGLALLKLGLFFLSGSLVVALSAWDSAADSLISLGNRFVLRYARADADGDHPYGHGKAESLAALAQGALIIGGSLTILVAAFRRFVDLSRGRSIEIDDPWMSVLVMAGAAVASLFITSYLKLAARKCNSPALHADSEHYRVDFASNVGSAVSLAIVARFGLVWLDPLIAILLAIYVAWGGLALIRDSLGILMDTDVSASLKEEALAVIFGVSESIVDIHNFRGRRSGHRTLFDFHLTLPASMAFEEVHTVVESVEQALKERFKGDSMIHPDPDSVPITASEVLYRTRRIES
jgi:cation diffusion facilitator family transporter